MDSRMSVSRENRISVALCTFNGERFLPRQLASIQQQTRLPDELVICDDRSTDTTLAIVRSFASSVSFPVKVMQNERNLGSTKNFENAMRLCSGDLIALSDQDDVWYPQRLARSEQELQSHPAAGLVFSDGEIIDDEDQSTGARMWPSTQFSVPRAEELLAGNYDLLLRYRFVTGATVMFRAPLRDSCLPIPAEWIHDEWLAAMVPAFADLRPIDEPLVRYRRHASQQVGLHTEPIPQGEIKDHWDTLGGERSDKYWNKLSQDIEFAQAICNRLEGIPLDVRGQNILAGYQAWLRFALFRSRLPHRRIARFASVLKRYGWYARHASGLLSAAKDLVRSRPR
jgi:glycosyltransferase involved in cell wall biosynthesis